MLLIVFVENAFKHSKNSGDQKIFIDIALKIWSNTILFSVTNSCSSIKDDQKPFGNNGMGLANVQKRLELLYPGEYDLKIEENESVYKIMLRLNAK